MAIYPDSIETRAAAPKFAGEVPRADAVGTAASLVCGSFVRYSLAVDARNSVITDIKFRSNGCGYMVAAADHLAEKLRGRPLTYLAGFTFAETVGRIEGEFGTIPLDRMQCAEICFDAIRAALRELRAARIAESGGKKALICTCFGVDKDAIERAITAKCLETVDDVAAETNAGAGCGSCRMLIQTMLDSDCG